MSKATVLIVEDKDEFRKIYGDRLRFGGHKVLDASDGIAALEVLEKEQVDVVMTDLNMPRMDGVGFIKKLRMNEAFKNLPVIVMSVFDQSEHLKAAMDAGATEYLVKGQYTPNAIAAKVEELIVKHTSA